MNNALIGYSGFVGSTLRRQAHFSKLYRSSNIAEVGNESFDLAVCCAAPAKKWIANQQPEQDKAIISQLIQHLDKVECQTFVLISTVDVFNKPVNVDENSTIDLSAIQPYGLHRYELEAFVRRRFERSLIVRLPGLVGPGLKKNIVFDFHNENQVEKIDSRAVFQFYPMVNLWFDIQKALSAKLSLLHLTSAPISVELLAGEGFARKFHNPITTLPARYDFQTCYADLFGGCGAYTYSLRESLQAVRAYAQSEPKTQTN